MSLHCQTKPCSKNREANALCVQSSPQRWSLFTLPLALQHAPLQPLHPHCPAGPHPSTGCAGCARSARHASRPASASPRTLLNKSVAPSWSKMANALARLREAGPSTCAWHVQHHRGAQDQEMLCALLLPERADDTDVLSLLLARHGGECLLPLTESLTLLAAIAHSLPLPAHFAWPPTLPIFWRESANTTGTLRSRATCEHRGGRGPVLEGYWRDNSLRMLRSPPPSSYASD